MGALCTGGLACHLDRTVGRRLGVTIPTRLFSYNGACLTVVLHTSRVDVHVKGITMTASQENDQSRLITAMDWHSRWFLAVPRRVVLAAREPLRAGESIALVVATTRAAVDCCSPCHSP